MSRRALLLASTVWAHPSIGYNQARRRRRSRSGQDRGICIEENEGER